MIRKVAASLLLMLFILCSAISIMRAANVQKCWQDSVSTILAPHTEEELSALEKSLKAVFLSKAQTLFSP